MRKLGGRPAEAQSSGAAAAFGVYFAVNGSQYYFRMTKLAKAVELPVNSARGEISRR